MRITGSKIEIVNSLAAICGCNRSSLADDVFDGIIQFFRDSGSYVQEKRVFPDYKPNTLAVMVPNTYYAIDTKNSILSILGVIIDIYGAEGTATMLLATLGITGKSINKLNNENGEICIYKIVLSHSDTGVSAPEVYNDLHNIECSYNEIKCYHKKKNGHCNISNKEISFNLEKMNKYKAIMKKGERWFLMDLKYDLTGSPII